MAGEAAGEDVDGGWVGEGADVGMAGDVGPVTGQDALAVGIALAVPEDSHTGAFEPEVEAADPGE